MALPRTPLDDPSKVSNWGKSYHTPICRIRREHTCSTTKFKQSCMSWDTVLMLCYPLKLFTEYLALHFGPMDVVGSPSEMLELWLMDDASFKFAVNAQGERIPDTLLHQLIASDAVGRGVRIRSPSVHVEVLCKHDVQHKRGINGLLTTSSYPARAPRP
mgnify:CR=1 FL=1